MIVASSKRCFFALLWQVRGIRVSAHILCCNLPKGDCFLSNTGLACTCRHRCGGGHRISRERVLAIPRCRLCCGRLCWSDGTGIAVVSTFTRLRISPRAIDVIRATNASLRRCGIVARSHCACFWPLDYQPARHGRCDDFPCTHSILGFWSCGDVGTGHFGLLGRISWKTTVSPTGLAPCTHFIRNRCRFRNCGPCDHDRRYDGNTFQKLDVHRVGRGACPDSTSPATVGRRMESCRKIGWGAHRQRSARSWALDGTDVETLALSALGVGRDHLLRHCSQRNLQLWRHACCTANSRLRVNTQDAKMPKCDAT
jgi:hypothetical protein